VVGERASQSFPLHLPVSIFHYNRPCDAGMTQNDSVKNSKLFVIIAVINTTRYRLLVGGETICPADGSSTVAYRFAANQSINQLINRF